MEREEEPLLAQSLPNHEPSDSLPGEKINLKVIAIIFMNVLVANIGYFISITPLTRVFEDITCRRYFQESAQTLLLNGTHGRPDEAQCKIPEVQGPVAQLFGVQTFLDGLVGILLGLYFGALADRIGRRPILTLASAGAFLGMCWTLYVCWVELPLQYVWFASAFLIIGGGSTVSNACLSMFLTDATPAALRSQVFLYFTASNLGSEVIAPPIASYFIDSNPWVPLIIGLCCTASTIVIAASVPETLKLKKSTVEAGDGLEEHGEAHEIDAGEGATKDGSFMSALEHTLESLKFICNQPGLLPLVCIFMVSDFARQSLMFLVQYVSARYHLTLGQANYLLSWRAAAAIMLNILVLPVVDRILQVKFSMPTRKKDLALARVSICLFTTGFLTLALAPTLAIVILGITLYTFGGAFGIFMRSIISTMVDPHRLGSLYSTLSIMDTAGSLLAGPLLAQALKWSISLGNGWSGLPYILSSLLCGAAAIVLFLPKPF